jgi:hypothetical protein
MKPMPKWDVMLFTTVSLALGPASKTETSGQPKLGPKRAGPNRVRSSLQTCADADVINAVLF